jgi:hypothetical protein
MQLPRNGRLVVKRGFVLSLRLGIAAASISAGFSLGACSVPLADLPVIGLPSGAPARPAEPVSYPAVHDVPSERAEPVLNPAEQAKIENDLKAARNRQAGAVVQSSKDTGQ